jgi:methionyl-tRNA formyltransferase
VRCAKPKRLPRATTGNAPRPVRNVFLGTSEFASAVLERLVASPFPPALVITRPDRPQGRGRRMQSPPVAGTARRLELDLIQPGDMGAPEVVDRIARASPEVLCVCAYGVMLREPLLSAYEVLNVHPSLLPRWRGAAPIERAIMAGDEETGVSIMRLVEALDAGPVCLQTAESIRSDDDAGSLGQRLHELGGELLVQALDHRPQFWEQPEAGVTYAEKIEARDRMLDFTAAARSEERRVRALHPHIGARLALPDGSFLGVRGARLARDIARVDPGRLHVDGSRLLLDCADAALELIEIQPAGARSMTASDWLRGRTGAALAAEPVRLARPVS